MREQIELLENHAHPRAQRLELSRGIAGPLAGPAQLEQIIRRGQRAGDFDRTLPAAWLAVAIVGLVRTGAEGVAAGRLTTSEAAALALDSTLRLCGAGARC